MTWTARNKSAAFLLLAACLDPANAWAGEIEIMAAGLKNTNGNVIFCLWREGDEGFPSCGESASFKKAVAPAASASIRLKDVPDGVYAITVVHDEEKIGKPKRNALGVPVSGIGLANNPSIGPFNRPTFNKASVSLKGSISLTIKMKYSL